MVLGARACGLPDTCSGGRPALLPLYEPTEFGPPPPTVEPSTTISPSRANTIRFASSMEARLERLDGRLPPRPAIVECSEPVPVR